MKEVCEVRRARTSTPLQALVLLNDPQVLEASRVLSYSELRKNIDDRARIADAFRRITGRKSSGKEIDMLYEFYTTELAKYKKNVDASKKLLKNGHYPQQAELDPASTAAMMLTIHTIYNLDETITKS